MQTAAYIATGVIGSPAYPRGGMDVCGMDGCSARVHAELSVAAGLLKPGTTYHVVVCARNQFGLSEGADASFTVPVEPVSDGGDDVLSGDSGDDGDNGTDQFPSLGRPVPPIAVPPPLPPPPGPAIQSPVHGGGVPAAGP